jgi:type I restriction enzyme M protein
VLGAIIGDVVGSRFEFHNRLSRDFAFFHPDCRFTDDTVMTCAVAQALMDSREDFSDLAEKTVSAMQRIGRQYPNCGYGGRFIHWMFTDDPQPYNSFGNGSAMRISPVGFAARDPEEAKKLSAAVTAVSHNHPEGMKGAEATAVAIVLARQGRTKEEIRKVMEEYYDLGTTVEEYRDRWQGHGKEICQVSLPQALACFFEGDSYEDVIRNCISIGGDSDTIAAIAGGIAEAYYGVPEEFGKQVRTYLDKGLLRIVDDFAVWSRERSSTFSPASSTNP